MTVYQRFFILKDEILDLGHENIGDSFDLSKDEENWFKMPKISTLESQKTTNVLQPSPDSSSSAEVFTSAIFDKNLSNYQFEEKIDPDEIVERRSRYSKVFIEKNQLGEVQYKNVIALEPIHYKDKDGYKEIHNKLVIERINNMIYRNAANSYLIRAGDMSGEGFLFENKNSQSCYFVIEGKNVKGLVKDNKITYPDIIEDYDLVLQANSEQSILSLLDKNGNQVEKELSVHVKWCEIPGLFDREPTDLSQKKLSVEFNF